MKKLKLLGKIAAFTMMLSVLPTVSSAASFTDVSEKHGAKKEIQFLVDKKIIKGYEDGTFKPSKTVTKAHVATMLARALDLNTTNEAIPAVTDVPVTHGSYKEIAAIINAGIMPVSNGEFAPYKEITRGEMARALVNAFKLEGNGNSNFSDVQADYWAAEYIDALATNGITVGYEDGTFRPAKSLTRAQFSSFLARALDKSFIQTPDSTDDPTSASKAPGTEKTSVSMNTNYTYTYAVRKFEGANYWSNETLQSTGKTADGWDVWTLVAEDSGDYRFQVRDTAKGYEYTLPKADSSLGHVYKIPYPLKKGSTWKDATNATYEVVDVEISRTVKAGTFKNIYVINVTENNKVSTAYYANNYGEILRMTADGLVQRELTKYKAN